MPGMLGNDELDRRLGFHPGTPDTAPLYEANRAGVLRLARAWDELLPPGRELALAQTALQEALLWANAAVATNLAPLGPERGASHPARGERHRCTDCPCGSAPPHCRANCPHTPPVVAGRG